MQKQPLAYRNRPTKLSDYFGQQHLLGAGKSIYQMLKHKHISSMILYGDSGIGKTTLAEIIAFESNAHFEQLSAVNAGVKDIRNILEIAKLESKSYNKNTILFLDEIHRFNKAQQDALLPYVENGDIILIGATTENPFFSVNKALRSRMMIFHLEILNIEDIRNIIQNTLKKDIYYKILNITIDDDAIQLIYQQTKGDARMCLTLLEHILQLSDTETFTNITKNIVNELLGSYSSLLDKNGDTFYDQLSAFHKSVRGSDPDASLFWAVNLIENGCDPETLFRRMLCIASEDIGNADPRALTIALDGWHSYERLGMPEGRIPLAQVITYLATAPKSNSSYKSYSNALESISKCESIKVPYHIRNILPAGIDKQEKYKYPFNYKDNFVHQIYRPQEVQNIAYYIPSDKGLEIKMKIKLSSLWNRF